MAFENIEELKKATEEDAKNYAENESAINESNPDSSSDFEKITDRLKEINDLLADESMPLEESLKYYEEAVKLGLDATQKVETNINEALITQEENSESESNEDSVNTDTDKNAESAVPVDSVRTENIDKTGSTTEIK